MKTNHKLIALEGNAAVALAMKQINPDVIAAYPITPQTEIVMYFSQYVADGAVDTEYVTVESEHSAMSACIGASASGARVMTATSSQGLALMWEMMYIASAARTPIVMPIVNRALSGPINIHGDHSDAMGARDSGWIMLFSENCQEAYDNTIQAIRIAEDPRVRLPVAVNLDGFITSHAVEVLETLTDEEVKSFVKESKPWGRTLLDVDNPITMGPVALTDSYMEFKRNQREVMDNVMPVILEIGKEFEKLTGRKYDIFEGYRLEDAEVAIVVMNSTAGTTKIVVDELRSKGIKAGLLKLRVFRPFPYRELVEALSHLKAVTVLDKADSIGSQGGPLFLELRSAFYEAKNKPLMLNYIYGLGGRDVTTGHIQQAFDETLEVLKTGKLPEKLYKYLGVRE